MTTEARSETHRSKPTIRTSATHPIGVAWLPGPLPGRVGLTLAPGKHQTSKSGVRWRRDLDADLERLVTVHRAHVLIVLLEDAELGRLHIPSLIDAARGHGLLVERYPMPDGGIPPAVEPVFDLVGKISGHALQGRNVVVLCAGGLGRSGVIGGCWLVSVGATAEAALRTLHDCRSRNCPENEAQAHFITEFAAFLGDGDREVTHGPPRRAPVKPGEVTFRKKTYQFGDWNEWDHTLNAAVHDFARRFGLYPHIMLAAEKTFVCIDMVKDKQKTVGPAGQHPESAEFAPLSDFEGEGYHLSFCVAEMYPKGTFVLIFDDGPPAPGRGERGRAGQRARYHG